MLLKQEIQGTSRPFSRLLGFYLNCEHVLFVNILKQRRKKCCGFFKKIRGFSGITIFFTKLKTFQTHF